MTTEREAKVLELTMENPASVCKLRSPLSTKTNRGLHENALRVPIGSNDKCREAHNAAASSDRWTLRNSDSKNKAERQHRQTNSSMRQSSRLSFNISASRVCRVWAIEGIQSFDAQRTASGLCVWENTERQEIVLHQGSGGLSNPSVEGESAVSSLVYCPSRGTLDFEYRDEWSLSEGCGRETYRMRSEGTTWGWHKWGWQIYKTSRCSYNVPSDGWLAQTTGTLRPS